MMIEPATAATARGFNRNLESAPITESSHEMARQIAIRLHVMMALYLRCKYNAKYRSTAINVRVKNEVPDTTIVKVSNAILRWQYGARCC